jgi:hypothetical protein
MNKPITIAFSRIALFTAVIFSSTAPAQRIGFSPVGGRTAIATCERLITQLGRADKLRHLRDLVHFDASILVGHLFLMTESSLIGSRVRFLELHDAVSIHAPRNSTYYFVLAENKTSGKAVIAMVPKGIGQRLRKDEHSIEKLARLIGKPESKINVVEDVAGGFFAYTAPGVLVDLEAPLLKDFGLATYQLTKSELREERITELQLLVSGEGTQAQISQAVQAALQAGVTQEGRKTIAAVLMEYAKKDPEANCLWSSWTIVELLSKMKRTEDRAVLSGYLVDVSALIQQSTQRHHEQQAADLLDKQAAFESWVRGEHERSVHTQRRERPRSDQPQLYVDYFGRAHVMTEHNRYLLLDQIAEEHVMRRIQSGGDESVARGRLNREWKERLKRMGVLGDH